MGDMTPQEINLYHLFGFYIKRWIWLILFTIAGGLLGFAYTNYIQTPLYKSDVTLLIVAPGDEAAAQQQNTSLINNYIELLSSRRVLEPVISKQKLDLSYEKLLDSLTVTNNKSTQVIKVSVSNKDARTSQLVLGGAIESFKEQVKKLYTTDNNIRVVDEANLPASPYNVHKELVTLGSSLAGLLLTIVVLFFVYDYKLNRSKNSKVQDKIENEPKIEQFKRRRFIRVFGRSMQTALFGDDRRIETEDKVKGTDKEPKL
jgi:capsular polysaccharide biosynthesis protein